MFSAQKNAAPASGKLFVEDVFSTWLYTGNGSTQTITNGIDLAGKGGMVWVKARGDLSPLGLTGSHTLYDTNRGTSNALRTNGTFASASISGVTAFNSNGFGLDTNGANNASGYKFASWTFRKAPKFFDVVTYTGNGASNRAIPHSLGIAPGCIFVKATNSGTDNWVVYHRSLPTPTNAGLYLNTTDATQNFPFFPTAPNANNFYVNGGGYYNNEPGTTYVAYLFAHDTTSDGFIQCGTYTGTGTSPGPTINLGWEPQWLLIKGASASGIWYLADTMRGLTDGTAFTDKYLRANASTAEEDDRHARPFSTGFQIMGTDPSTNQNGQTFIYVAIRRGPMRTPTSGTSVFNALLRTGDGSAFSQTGLGFTPDTLITTDRGAAYTGWKSFYDRLRGVAPQLNSTSTNAEITSNPITSFDMDGASFTSNAYFSGSGANYIFWYLKRAPSFFDEVCYTGNGTPGGGGTRAINHNLGVSPEFVIVKNRSNAYGWTCYYPAGNNGLLLNGTNASFTPDFTGVSSTTFTVKDFNSTNATGNNYVAYLFASCPGVSKVGSYTGNGSSQTINCGFAAGARFVLIKRTDSTGDWYVWDTARGIVAANDPHLSLNTTDAEVTTDDSIDPNNSGFIVNQVAATNINVSSATYIYLAVA